MTRHGEFPGRALSDFLWFFNSLARVTAGDNKDGIATALSQPMVPGGHSVFAVENYKNLADKTGRTTEISSC